MERRRQARIRNQHREEKPSREADVVPFGEFASPSEKAVVIGLLRSAGIPAFVDRRHYGRGITARILIPRDTLEDANLLIQHAMSHSDLKPERAAPAADELQSLMTRTIWIVAATMFAFLIYDVYKWARYATP